MFYVRDQNERNENETKISQNLRFLYTRCAKARCVKCVLIRRGKSTLYVLLEHRNGTQLRKNIWQRIDDRILVSLPFRSSKLFPLAGNWFILSFFTRVLLVTRVHFRYEVETKFLNDYINFRIFRAWRCFTLLERVGQFLLSFPFASVWIFGKGETKEFFSLP